MLTADLPTACSHYMCRRTDIAPVIYVVLGSAFDRWLCPDHAPKEG